MKKFVLKTLGCKVNQCESETLATDLITQGWRPAADTETADICIINTCAVTGKAAMQSRQIIRRCRRENPDALVIVTGCYATVGETELEDTGVVDRVVGHAEKSRIPEILEEMFPDDALSQTLSRSSELTTISTGGLFKTRAFLKIQDGCNSFCTYCIVPYARGRSVSMPTADVLAAVRSLSEAGYREVVLSGIHMGVYGADLSPATSLHDLLERLLEANLMQRIRLSSIEPGELGADIIERVASADILCNHFHIPLQSGSDKILKQMGRPYTAAFFSDLVYTIKQKIPQAAVGADVLVGFPGEGERAFTETCEVIKDAPVSYLHVFPFSPRPGTPACDYANHVHPAVIKERCRILREIGREKNRIFCSENSGQTAQVLVESKRDEKTGRLKGVTSNYLTVLIAEDGLSAASEFVSIRLGEQREGLTVEGLPV